MLIHPWDAATGPAEWQDWPAAISRFGILAVNNSDPAQAPLVLLATSVHSAYPGRCRSGGWCCTKAKSPTLTQARTTLAGTAATTATVTFAFHDAVPLRRSGLAAPQIAVLVAWILYGEGGLAEHPHSRRSGRIPALPKAQLDLYRDRPHLRHRLQGVT
jgi:hypothetical protein